MRDRYLEVTFRAGKMLAAYLYLPRNTGDRSASVRKAGPGLLVDLTTDGRPIGIEIAMPNAVKLEQVNAALALYGLPPVASADLAPLQPTA